MRYQVTSLRTPPPPHNFARHVTNATRKIFEQIGDSGRFGGMEIFMGAERLQVWQMIQRALLAISPPLAVFE